MLNRLENASLSPFNFPSYVSSSARCQSPRMSAQLLEWITLTKHYWIIRGSTEAEGGVL